MDPVIQAVVNALAAGALAASKDVASDAVKKTYAALKSFIVGRVAQSASFVDVVDQAPSEATASLLAAKISPIAGDSEAERLAADLRAAIEQIGTRNGADAVLTLLNSRIGTFKASGNQSSRPLANLSSSTVDTVEFTNNNFDGKKKPNPSSP